MKCANPFEVYYEDGSIKYIQYLDSNGQIHRDDAPAKIEYHYGTDIVRVEHYITHGIYHSEDKPSIIFYNINGSIRCVTYCLNNQKHRNNDLPASIVYHDNGRICSEHYYHQGMIHRDNNPALIYNWVTGEHQMIHYYQYGKRHRIGKPASIHYSVDTTSELYSCIKQHLDGERTLLQHDIVVTKECYYLNNKEHREDGPALIIYNNDGTVDVEWYKHGVTIDGNAFIGLTPDTNEWKFTYDML